MIKSVMPCFSSKHFLSAMKWMYDRFIVRYNFRSRRWMHASQKCLILITSTSYLRLRLSLPECLLVFPWIFICHPQLKMEWIRQAKRIILPLQSSLIIAALKKWYQNSNRLNQANNSKRVKQSKENSKKSRRLEIQDQLVARSRFTQKLQPISR